MSTRKHVPISPESLPRFILWTWLQLFRYAWFLVFDGPEAKAWLAHLRRRIARIIVLRAAHRFAPRARKIHGRITAASGFRQRARVSRTHAARALIGRKLWRALRARGCGVWLSALFAVLQDIDAWTDHVARRYARQLTRLRPILPVRPPARGFIAPAPAPALLSPDTS